MSKAKKLIQRIKSIPYNIESIYNKATYVPIVYDAKDPKVLTGRLLSDLNKNKESIKSLTEVEFQVFSQWGDDGIIQYLINKIDIPNKTFIEFGVENYKESNTRFLLINNNWSGLVMDGSDENIKYIANDMLSWAHELHAWSKFITRENINSLMNDFLQLGYDKEIGILSVDIDGNDYWVWKEIDVINPVIVISEYNSLFELNPWTIPYAKDFWRPSDNKNPLHTFYGSSLKSLCGLAEIKGYYFIGCNSAGNNAYFVRKDKIGTFKPLTAEEGYVLSKFREHRAENGAWVSGKDRSKGFIGKEVYNTEIEKVEIIK